MTAPTLTPEQIADMQAQLAAAGMQVVPVAPTEPELPLQYFDDAGWHSADPIEGRSTRVQLPADALADGFGWNWTGHAWAALPLVPPEVAAPELPQGPRRIKVGAFYERFGDQMLTILASEDPVVKGMLAYCTAKTQDGLDMDSPIVKRGVSMLKQKWPSLDVDAILTAPLRTEEAQ